MKCHEFYFDRIEQTYNNKLLFLFRLDMCRRSHANDVCNRGTAGNFYGKRDLLEPKCFFILMFFFIFIFLNVNFLYCTFHLLSNNIKINFIPSSTTHQNKYSLSLLLYVYIFLFFTCTHSCDYILHSPKLFFSLPSPQWKKVR